MSPPIRAFIAIDLPPAIKDMLGLIQTRFKPCPADVAWVKPLNCHLTLKFLGNIPTNQVDHIHRVMKDWLKDQPGFYVKTEEEVGAFPTLEKPQILWMGLRDEAGQLVKLARELEERLVKIGIPREMRPFHPHITFGRVRAADRERRLGDLLKTITVPPEDFAVCTITLFQSRLAHEGPTYTPLYTWPLGPVTQA